MSTDLFLENELDSFVPGEEDFAITPSARKKRDLEARRKIETLNELKRLRELSGDPAADFDSCREIPYTRPWRLDYSSHAAEALCSNTPDNVITRPV